MGTGVPSGAGGRASAAAGGATDGAAGGGGGGGSSTGGGGNAGGGGAGRSSGGVKPRLGNTLGPCVATRVAWSGIALSTRVLVSLPERLLDQASGVGVPVWLAAKWLPSRSAEPASVVALPIWSGITRSAKATNESEPRTRATQGAQRQVITLGIPISRIRRKTNPVARGWPGVGARFNRPKRRLRRRRTAASHLGDFPSSRAAS